MESLFEEVFETFSFFNYFRKWYERKAKSNNSHFPCQINKKLFLSVERFKRKENSWSEPL